jgi:hypothetical protein
MVERSSLARLDEHRRDPSESSARMIYEEAAVEAA